MRIETLWWVAVAIGILGCDGSETEGEGGGSDRKERKKTSSATGTNPVTCYDLAPESRVTCSCQSDGEPGEPEYDGPACAIEAATDFCCQDADYPASGKCSCNSYKDWYCAAQEGGACYCGFHESPPAGAYEGACDDNPDQNGNPWFCCKWSEFDTCACYPGAGGPSACGAGEAVADCATAEAAGSFSYTSACAEGQIQTDVCSTASEDPGTCSETNCSGCDTYCDTYGCSTCCYSCYEGECHADC